MSDIQGVYFFIGVATGLLRVYHLVGLHREAALFISCIYIQGMYTVQILTIKEKRLLIRDDRHG